MVKTLVDMYVKQQGSYKRLINIARSDYPKAELVRTKTVILYGYPVLLLTIDTKE